MSWRPTRACAPCKWLSRIHLRRVERKPLSIRVECHAGYRGEEEPRAFTLGERRFAVEEILDRWLDPRHRYFKVKVDDGRRFIVRHDTLSGEWELAALVHAGTPGV